jgi:hypothetical protein
VENVGHGRRTQSLEHDTEPIQQFFRRLTGLMLVRQIIGQPGQRNQPTLDPTADRLELAQKAVFKANSARVGDAIDRVEREYDASRLEANQLTSASCTGEAIVACAASATIKLSRPLQPARSTRSAIRSGSNPGRLGANP